MQIKIFHSVNSGLYFWNGQSGLLVDGLHGCGPYQCFSSMPPELRMQMVHKRGLFAHLDAVLFSHAHGDHCDPDAMYYVKNSPSPVPCYLHGGQDNTLLFHTVDSRVLRADVGPFTVYAIDTTHNGIDYKRESLFKLPTCVFFIQHEGERFLICADGQLSVDDLSLFSSFGPIELAFCNIYHLKDPDSLSFFRGADLKRLAIYHLPFDGDDVFLYRAMATQLNLNPPEGIPHPFLMPHMSWLDGRCPGWAL